MSERFDLLKPTLDAYKRRFTVLDIGAGAGEVIKEIGQHYDAVVVAVEKDFDVTPGYDVGSYRTVPGALCIKHEMSAHELQLLSECEHFDVVLAFNVLHWFGAEWREAMSAVLGMGDHVFIQLPPLDEETSPGFDFRAAQLAWVETVGRGIGNTIQFPGHAPRTVWHVQLGVSRVLTRASLYAHAGSAETTINATKEGITYHNARKNTKGTWIAGINLWNFICLGGLWPQPERVVEMLETFELPDENHGDVVPWNFIIDGEYLYLVDGFEGWGNNDRESIQGTLTAVKNRYTTEGNNILDNSTYIR